MAPDSHPTPLRPRLRGWRAAAGLLLAVALLGLAACGLNVQTLQPYTPSDGVNADVGNPPVQVRNLMILSREDGSGFLSATLGAQGRDALTSVSGKPIKPDGTDGAAFAVTQPDPVAFGSGSAVVLTDRPFIELKSADLVVGADAELTLVFSTVGSITLRAPVVDAEQPDYATVTPSATPSS